MTNYATMTNSTKPILAAAALTAAVICLSSKSKVAPIITHVQTITRFSSDDTKYLAPGTAKVILMSAANRQNDTFVMMAVACDKAGNILRLGETIKQQDENNDPVITTKHEDYDQSGKIGQDKEIDFPKSGHTFLGNLPKYTLRADFTFPQACNGKIPSGFVAQLNDPLPPSYKIIYRAAQPKS